MNCDVIILSALIQFCNSDSLSTEEKKEEKKEESEESDEDMGFGKYICRSNILSKSK